MRKVYILSYMVLLMLTGVNLMGQKRDTTQNKEEILIASELFQKSDAERRLMLLRPRFRYVNTGDKPSLIKVGYRHDFGVALGGVYSPDRRYAPNIAFGFEQLFRNSSLSWNVETLTRLGDRPLGAFEYRIRSQSDGQGEINGRRQDGGEFYNHRFRVHLSLRYYYNKNKRTEAEASGHNTASEYVFFRMRDLLGYTELDDYRFSSDQQLESHVFSKKWLSRPSYFSMGWGIQRPFLNKALLDFNIEFGKRFPTSDFEHFYQDFFFDINLFIGLGL